MPLELIKQTETGVNQDALEFWMDYRAEDLKKPMTPRAIKMVKKKLCQWSEKEQERLIYHAVEFNWMGIYWVDPPMAAENQSTRAQTLAHDLSDTSWAQQ